MPLANLAIYLFVHVDYILTVSIKYHTLHVPYPCFDWHTECMHTRTRVLLCTLRCYRLDLLLSVSLRLSVHAFFYDNSGHVSLCLASNGCRFCDDKALARE